MMTNSPFWLGTQPLILASASRARLRLLEAAAIPLEVKPARFDERGIEDAALGAHASPSEVARLLAGAKGKQVSSLWPGRVVLGADQILSVDGKILHKPRSGDELKKRLRLLSGRSHTLWSAAAVARDGKAEFETSDKAVLTFRRLSSEFIERYVSSAAAGDLLSVGGYEVEGLGAHLLESVVGQHATVLGMPLTAILEYFRNAGLLAA